MFVSPFASPFPSSPFGGKNISVKVQQTNPHDPAPNEKRYINFNAGNDGCMAYRRGFVSNHIRLTGYGDVVDLTKMVTEKGFYQNITAISLQRQAAGHQKQFMEFLKSIQPEFGFKLIYEVDDVVFREEIPDHNASKFGFDNDEIRQNCVDMINMVDEVTVTCQYMKDLYTEKTGQQKITVVPNFMPHWWIGHQYNYRKICDNLDKNKKRPRIVYAGSGAHFDVKNNAGGQDDFSHVIKFIVDNRFKYQFVFIGAFPPPLHPFIQAKEIEFHPWVSLLDYPNFLSTLNAQLFIAPLMDIPFNRSKSDIKFIEAAQLGIPCLCQDMITYSTAPEFLRFKTADELAEKIEMLTNWKNRSKYYKLVPELRELGAKRFLEHQENISCYLEAFDTPWGSNQRHYLKKWNR
jgi:glycosyltransferase involved in cell wall biosynthesis